MSDDQDKQRSEAEADLEREIRQGRKFTAKEAMGRMLGPGAMKGGSAVSKVQAAEIEIETWLRSNLNDSTGALQALLPRQLKGSVCPERTRSRTQGWRTWLARRALGRRLQSQTA
jgi:hypothetical protein